MRLNLQQKIMAGLLLPTVVLLLLFQALAAYSLRSTDEHLAAQEASLHARQIASDWSVMLRTAAVDARRIASMSSLRPDLSDTDYLAWLQVQLADSPAVFGLGVTFAGLDAAVPSRELYVYRGGDGVLRKDRPRSAQGQRGLAEWFSQAQQSGKSGWTPAYFDEAAGKLWLVSFSVPFARGADFEGAAVADVQLNRLAAAVGAQLPEAQWLLIDPSGRVVHADDARFVGRPHTDWAPANTARSRYLGAVLKGETPPPQLLAWPDERERVTATATVATTGWTLVYGASQEQLSSLSAPMHLTWLLVLMLICGIGIMLLLHYLLRMQMRPLRRLVQAARQLSRGSGRASQPVEAEDEVGVLSDGMDALASQLQGRDQHLLNRQRELGDRVREQQVLYRVADTLSWVDMPFTEMLARVTELLPEAWPQPDLLCCRINLAEFQSASRQFVETQRGLFAPIPTESGSGGGVWVFASDEASSMEAGQQELLEGVAQQLGLAYRRERAQEQLEKLNRELEQRVELRTDALRKAERLLRDITNSMPGAVYQVVQQPPKHAELRFVSAGVEEVFGIPRDRALASYDSLMGLVFPADLSELNAVVANAIGRRHAYSHVHRITHGQSGEVRWIRAAANTVLEADGSVLLNGYWIDVTDQKELELALETAKLDADAANEAKSRFLANMSHEIRTPMNAIIGLTHLALQQTHELKARDQLSRVEDSAKALLGLLNDILDFSKIEAGRMTVERIPFDLWNLLDRVESLMADRAQEKGLRFNVWRVPSLPRDLMGDPLRLHQVLLNLVSNAIKFTETGSVTLNATISQEGDSHVQIVFEVVDSGVGIDPITMTRLFSAFTQADNSTTRRFGGTGLGLTICKELVALMGGRITVDSTPGAGSSFSVSLGFDRADPSWREELLAHAGESRIDPLLGARVLLVDDNYINLEVAGELLRQSQVEVVTATNGREAIEKLMQSEYDAVLMDLQMPVMDGLTATMQIRLDPELANLPIIAMTANAMAGDRERCIAAGMNDHIPKPIDPDELRRTLARWLRRRSTGDLGSTIPPIL